MTTMLLDITAFVGRFHPLIVHLPIGFILIAVLLEWKFDGDRIKTSIAYIWLASAVSAMISSLFGWFLANEGSYANWPLFFHRWLGIGLIFLCLYAWYIRKGSASKKKPRLITNVLAFVMLAITGHLGGNMTHGSDYLLEHAPSPIQKLMGYGKSNSNLPIFTNADSVVVYEDIIYPTIEKKCQGCHNEKVQNGGLDLTSIEAISKGGDGGPIVIAGDLESELLRRVTLPTSSSKFMPTSGTPLSYHEVKLLEWWIVEGADFQASVANTHTSPSVQSTLLNLYQLDLTPRRWIEKEKVENLDSLSFIEMRSSGLIVNQIAQSNGWVEVRVSKGQNITEEQLESLSKAKLQITWLDLSGAQVSDQDLAYIGSLTNLTRLRLQNNPITSEGVKSLLNLDHLESLNLNNSQVSDELLELINSLESLKTIYIWQTKISEDKISQARSSGSNVEIIAGE